MTKNNFIQIVYTIGILLLMSCNDMKHEGLQSVSFKSNTDSVINDTTSIWKDEKKVWADTVDKQIHWSLIIDNEQISQLEFNEIDKLVYSKYKRRHTPTFTCDSSRITVTDSFFTIQTSKAKLKYPNEYNKNYGKRYGFRWVNYKGYIAPLHLYVMQNWSSGEFDLGYLFFVDSLSNILYNPAPLGDGPAEFVMLSPNNRYLAIGIENFIKIGELTNLNGVIEFKEVAQGNAPGDIADIVWIDDLNLALKLNSKPYWESMDKLRDEYATTKIKL